MGPGGPWGPGGPGAPLICNRLNTDLVLLQVFQLQFILPLSTFAVNSILSVFMES